MDVHPIKNGINRYWSIPISNHYGWYLWQPASMLKLLGSCEALNTVGLLGYRSVQAPWLEGFWANLTFCLRLKSFRSSTHWFYHVLTIFSTQRVWKPKHAKQGYKQTPKFCSVLHTFCAVWITDVFTGPNPRLCVHCSSAQQSCRAELIPLQLRKWCALNPFSHFPMKNWVTIIFPMKTATTTPPVRHVHHLLLDLSKKGPTCRNLHLSTNVTYVYV